MTPAAAFNAHMGQLNRRMLRRRLANGAMLFFTLTLGFHALLLGWSWFGLPISRWAWFSGGALALALVLAGGWDRIKKPGPAQTLGAMDQQYDLKELLTTAFEYHQRRDRSVFRSPLTRRANQVLDDLDPRQWCPGRWGPRLGAMGAALVLLAVAVVWRAEILPWDPPGRAAEDVSAVQAKVAAEKMLAFVREERRREPVPDGTPGLGANEGVLSGMAQQARDLARNTPHAQSTGRFVRSLEALSRRLDDAHGRLWQQLMDELWSGESDQSPAAGPGPAEGAPSQALDRLQEQLTEQFGGHLPRTVAESLRALAQNRRLAHFLRQVFDDLGLKELGPGQVQSEDPPTTGVTVAAQQIRGGGSDPGGQGQAAPMGDTSGPPAPLVSGSGRGQAEPSPSAMDDNGSPETTTIAGRGRGREDQQGLSEPPALDGPVVPDKGQTGARPRYNRYVLSLPLTRGADLPREAVVRSYAREVEAVLHREDIPEPYREFIKTYFLSIELSQPKE